MKEISNYLMKFKRLKMTLLANKISAKFLFIIMGIASTAWFLIRVIPKPQRASYPCMRTAAPLMSGFIIYILSLGSLTLLFKKSITYLKRARYWSALFAFVLCLVLLAVFNIRNSQNVFANTAFTRGVLPDSPNSPVGEANGIFPGRVVWSYNPAATNENCTNTISNAYFMASNTNQDTINKMANQAVKSLGGKNTVNESWDAIFKSFNKKKTGTESGYVAGQKIFIKINNGQAGWAINYSTLAETGQYSSGTGQSNIAMANTSPQAVLAFLVQLIDSCGIDQSNIMIGEPMTHVYKSMYDIVHPIYPDVKLMDKEDHTSLGRTTSAGWKSTAITYSDKGKVMTSAITDDMMQEMYDANYMINIAALKAHARSGVTFCAKNHFGSSTHGNSYSAERLHVGSINPNSDNDNLTNARGDYHMYRVLTDLMGHEKLGGNTVLFVVDGLWGGIEATDMPVKWEMVPFNNDFPSSLFVSQDEIALESVCLDFLRAEANTNTYFNDRPYFPAVDDYLHQGATKANWPDSIKNQSNKWFAFAGYDPEGDGTLMPASLGIHEHWNNSASKQYSRNLFTNGTGIELVTFPKSLVAYNSESAFNLTITVTDKNGPLENAKIIINGSNYLTDSDGKVIIGDLKTVTGLVYSVSKKGYKTSTGKVDISADKVLEIELSEGTVVIGISDIISDSQLSLSAYPNPMTSECTISYVLKSNATISLVIASLDGKIIEQIEKGQASEGSYTQIFNAEKLKSGLYLCVLKAQYADKTELKTLKLQVR